MKNGLKVFRYPWYNRLHDSRDQATRFQSAGMWKELGTLINCWSSQEAASDGLKDHLVTDNCLRILVEILLSDLSEFSAPIADLGRDTPSVLRLA